MMDAIKSGSSSTLQKPVQQPGTVKLFVGGLTGEMTKETLAEYFKDYAEIEDSFVVYENQKPSGFGFITVKDKPSADKILQTRHIVNYSILDVKPALDRAQAKDKEESDRRRKIFVGGLPKNFSDSSLKEFFEVYGPVQKCYVVKDTMTGKTRGFGFVIFTTDEGYLRSLEIPNMIIGGNDAHVKAATTKHDHRNGTHSEKTYSPATKKAKKSKKSYAEKTNETHHYYNNQRDQSPINYHNAQFQTSPSLYEEYDPDSPSHFNGGYFEDWARQAPMLPYVPYHSAYIPVPHAAYYASPYQYPVQPVHSPATFYSPKQGQPHGHAVQSGQRLQLYPLSNGHIYYEHPYKPFVVKSPATKMLYSTEAVAYRPQVAGGGSMVNTRGSPTQSHPAKSAHLIGITARHFGQSDNGYQRPAQANLQKYSKNPFGAHEDEEEDVREGLKRAGDF